MAGIVSFGAYVPRYRMPRMTLFMNMGWFNPVTMAVAKGEKAIANVDQDAITLAVDAAVGALGSEEGKDLDAIYFASTTLPYAERLNAGVIAAGLDLKPEIRAADFAGGIKSGTTALIAGCEAAAGGKQVLVTAADCRMGKAGSMQEMLFGDAGAAVILGTKDVIAEYIDSYSVTYDFVDHFRREDNRFDRTWEERWVRDLGYSRMIPQVLKGLLDKTKTAPGDIAKVVYPCHFDRVHKDLLKKFVAPEKVQDNLGLVVGDSGAAHPLLMLAAALETAKPGDKIIVAGYGSGADALLFQVTPAISKVLAKPFTQTIARKEALNAYTKYLVFKNMIPVEVGIRGELQSPTAFSTYWRELTSIMGMVASKCKACGNVVFPRDRVCPKCLATGPWEPYLLRNKKAKLFTFTGDMLAFTFDPPQFYGMIDFEAGARVQLDFTDCKQEDLKVGDPVELTFRRKYRDDLRGIYGYTWKAVPGKK